MFWLIRSVMCALYPAAGDMPGLGATDIDAFLRRMRREAPAILWVGLAAGALVFTLTPVFTTGIPLPAFLLSARARDRHAFKITSHPVYLVRQAVFLVKFVAGLCWAQHPAVRERFHLAAYPADPGTWRTR
jgi:hypothetical protein